LFIVKGVVTGTPKKAQPGVAAIPVVPTGVTFVPLPEGEFILAIPKIS
jgi:hypothetical protein